MCCRPAITTPITPAPRKLRSLIPRDFTQAFEKCDVLLTPATPGPAFAFGDKTDDPVEMYLNDVFTVTVNLAGLPGLSVPAGLSADGLPLGLQLIGKAFDEATVLRVGRAVENAANFTAKPQTGGGPHERATAHKLHQGPDRRRGRSSSGWRSMPRSLSKSKLFSGASTEFGAEPNTQVSFVDAAMPGMLPVINRNCVEQAVRTGLGLKAKINLTIGFDRKNYFYPDLPAGYQISQYKNPIVGEGEVFIDLPGRRECARRDRAAASGAGRGQEPARPASRPFLCRSQPLRHRPDGDRHQARHALQRGSGGLPEETARHRALSGHLRRQHGRRLDARRRQRLGAQAGRARSARAARSRTSIPCASSPRRSNTRRAGRSKSSKRGGTIKQETRLFDAKAGETRSMRSKEEAHDYRYFPDPDLLPLELEQAWVDDIAASLPELPDEKKARFIDDGPVGL